MALDRFVYFKKGRRPKKKEAELVVRNYFGGCGEVEWSGDRWTVSLPGTPTWVFEGIETALMLRTRNTERWIEVYWTRSKVDVITRRQDEFTNALALGLAQVFARYWDGELDDGT